MRIAQVAPLAESIPPKLYGGSERVVSWLTEELVARGHDVTLFAAGDSTTRAKLLPVWPRALRLGRPRIDPVIAQAVALEVLGRHAAEFDVIHCHVDWTYLPFLSRFGVPFVTTMHGRLDLPGLPHLVDAFPRAPFISISDNQRSPLPNARWLATIYHGLPLHWTTPSYEPGQYLAFLGRLTPDKGPEAAIRIAKAAGMPLRIAAKIPRGDNQYFKDHLEPLVDGRQIQLVGEVDDHAKKALLANAAALLFPIDWPEPFGLVMIEAMACGTPVIAYRNGSVEEVVENAVSGFIVDNEEEAGEALSHLHELDRRRIRQAFEARFTASRMTSEYLRCYQEIADCEADLQKTWWQVDRSAARSCAGPWDEMPACRLVASLRSVPAD